MHKLIILDHYFTLIAWAIGVSADTSHLLDLLKPLLFLIEHVLSIHGDTVLIFLFDHDWVGLAHSFVLNTIIRARFFWQHHQFTNSVNFFIWIMNYWLGVFLLFWRNWTLRSLNNWGLRGGATLVDVLKLRNLSRLLHSLLLLDSIEL